MNLKRFLLPALFLLHSPLLVAASTTIDPVNRYGYGANLGWINCRGDVNNGAVVGEYICSGYIYGANVGWINLGTGFPTNGIQYRNVAANDFSVNLDAGGNLSGCAWDANIGWACFPRVARSSQPSALGHNPVGIALCS